MEGIIAASSEFAWILALVDEVSLRKLVCQHHRQRPVGIRCHSSLSGNNEVPHQPLHDLRRVYAGGQHFCPCSACHFRFSSTNMGRPSLCGGNILLDQIKMGRNKGRTTARDRLPL